MKSKVLITGLTLCLAMGILFLACSKNSSPNPYNNNNGNNNTGSTGNAVSISNFSFVSNNLAITKGATVTWTNNDNTAHTVTADDNSFTSGSLNKGDTYSHTFNTAGTIAYHCNFHPMMTATVVVN